MRTHPILRIAVYLLLCFLFVSGLGRLLPAVGPIGSFLPPFLGITAATLLARRLLDRRPLIGLGLSWNRLAAPDLALGLLLPPVLLGAILASEWAAGWTIVAAVKPLTGRVLAELVISLAMVAWYEELSTRGYLLQNLARSMPAWAANLLSALFFAGLHALNPNAGPAAVLGVALAGLVLGWATQTTGALFLPMAFHLSWNLSLVLLGYPVSGIALPGPLQLVRTGPALFSGGGFGPEAGLSGFAALLIALGIFSRYARFRAAVTPSAT